MRQSGTFLRTQDLVMTASNKRNRPEPPTSNAHICKFVCNFFLTIGNLCGAQVCSTVSHLDNLSGVSDLETPTASGSHR